MASGFDLSAPAGYLWSVTPTDSATYFTMETRALYVGGAGDVKLDTINPDTQNVTQVTLSSVPAGTVLAVKTKRILSTGTSATNIIGMA